MPPKNQTDLTKLWNRLYFHKSSFRPFTSPVELRPCCVCFNQGVRAFCNPVVKVKTTSKEWGEWADRFICKRCAFELGSHSPRIERLARFSILLKSDSTVTERIIEQLRKEPGLTVNEVAIRLSLTNSTVKRELTALFDLGSVERKTENVSGGKPYFIWFSTGEAPEPEIRQLTLGV